MFAGYCFQSVLAFKEDGQCLFDQDINRCAEAAGRTPLREVPDLHLVERNLITEKQGSPCQPAFSTTCQVLEKDRFFFFHIVIAACASHASSC